MTAPPSITWAIVLVLFALVLVLVWASSPRK